VTGQPAVGEPEKKKRRKNDEENGQYNEKSDPLLMR